MRSSTMAKTRGVWTILSGPFLLFIILTETNGENSALEAITPFILLGATFGAVGIYILGGFNKAGRVALKAMIAGSVLSIAGISSCSG
ncbi:MAG: hypothetical protein IPL78_35725 [Chloroflexi bacterium]|nr:hypothetical protein [Chloroflexota bacterium]